VLEEGSLLETNTSSQHNLSEVVPSVEGGSTSLSMHDDLLHNKPTAHEPHRFLNDWSSFLDSAEFPPWIVSCDPSREPSVGFGFTNSSLHGLSHLSRVDSALYSDTTELDPMEQVRDRILDALSDLKVSDAPSVRDK
jgi:hypothetical protein